MNKDFVFGGRNNVSNYLDVLKSRGKEKELDTRTKVIYLYDDLVKHIPKNSKLCAAMIFRGKYIGADAVREIVEKIKALKEKPKDPISYFMELSGEYTTKLQ